MDLKSVANAPMPITKTMPRTITITIFFYFCDRNQLTIKTRMDSSEKLCLQWNDFKDNVSSSFGDLREDRDFTDVTLACEDGQQVEAHKVILASSSPFFKDILKRNKHPHPLIFMRGLKSEDLVAIVDFLYFGETNVFQENLDSFLALAEELRLKGLTDNSDKTQEPAKNAEPIYQSAKVKTEKTKQNQVQRNFEHKNSTNADTAVALENLDSKDLDEQIKSMMTKTDKGGTWKCNICGKMSSSSHMIDHIEANHITGVSHACDICGKTSRSRMALATHKNSFHKTVLQDQR